MEEGFGYSLVVGVYVVCERCEIESRDGEVLRQVMDHLPLHQVDIAELVEPLADNGPTLKSAHQSSSRGRFSFYETLTLFQ